MRREPAASTNQTLPPGGCRSEADSTSRPRAFHLNALTGLSLPCSGDDGSEQLPRLDRPHCGHPVPLSPQGPRLCEQHGHNSCGSTASCLLGPPRSCLFSGTPTPCSCLLLSPPSAELHPWQDGRRPSRKPLCVGDLSPSMAVATVGLHSRHPAQSGGHLSPQHPYPKVLKEPSLL